MDDENRSAKKGEVADILQKKEDLMALFKDNESKLEDRVSALEDSRVRRTHRPPKHKSAVKDPAQRADALFEQAVKRSRGMTEAAAEESPKPQAETGAGVADFDLSALTQAKEKLAREIAEEESDGAVQPQADAAAETEGLLHPDAVEGRKDLDAIPDLSWDITPHEPEDSEAEEAPAAEIPETVTPEAAEAEAEAAPVLEPAAADFAAEAPEEAVSQAEESLFDEEPLFEESPVTPSAAEAAPEAETPSAADLFFKEETLEEAVPAAENIADKAPDAQEASLFEEEAMTDAGSLFDEEPLFEESPVTPSAAEAAPEAKTPSAADLFFKEETLEEAAPAAEDIADKAPAVQEASLFEEEAMTDAGSLFDEEPLFEESPVTPSAAEAAPEAETPSAADLFFKEETLEEAVPAAENIVDKAPDAQEASLFEEEAMTDTGSLFDEEPLFEETPIADSPAEDIPASEKQRAAMDEFFRMSGEEEEIPSIFNKSAAPAPAEKAAAPEEGGGLWEEEELTEAAPAEAPSLFEEEALDEAPAEKPAADALFEEEVLTEDSARPAAAGDLWGDIPGVQAEAADSLFEEETMEAPAADQAPAASGEDSLFDVEDLQDGAAAPAEDLFETETLKDDAAAPADDLFETETLTDSSDLFDTLDIPVEGGTPQKAASPDQAEEEGKHRLGELQHPTVGPSGEAGQTMGMEAAADKADALGYSKGVFVLSAVFTGIALAALIVYVVLFRGSFNRVDVLTFVIMGIFLILSFDMKPVATVLVSAGLMAGYFLMEIYWAGSQSLTLGLSNMLMEGLIPLVLIPCSFFVTGLMARKSGNRPKQIEETKKGSMSNIEAKP